MNTMRGWVTDNPRVIIREGDCLAILPEYKDERIDLIFTSPPYFNARPEYSVYDSYRDYQRFMAEFVETCYEVLPSWGRLVMNVPNCYGRNPALPIGADMTRLICNVGFVLRGVVIWDKGTPGGSTAWGSWRSPSNPFFRDGYEILIAAHKENPRVLAGLGDLDDPADCEKGEMSATEFMSASDLIWRIKAETNPFDRHPAAFPLELATRVIKFFTFHNGVVCDPFTGSGTTALAAYRLGRRFIGMELNPDYYLSACKRVRDEANQPSLFPLNENMESNHESDGSLPN